MSDFRECQGSPLEGLYSDVGGALFAFAMGLSAVVIPLVALMAGFGAGEVGVLIAFSAVAQLGVRSVMGRLMRHLPDKYFVAAAGVLMSLSCAVLVVSVGVWAFVLSQLAQGAARGVFWTGSQTHVVRTTRTSSVAAIARLNLTSGVGQILGPLLAGPLIEHYSAEATLVVGALLGLLVVAPSALLARLEPLRPARKPRAAAVAALREPGVGLASWAGGVAGGWRAMMNSYVPVVLAGAGHGASVVGVVVGIANAASIAGTSAAGRIRIDRLHSRLVLAIVGTGVGLALFGALAGEVVVATASIAAAGVAAGVLQTAGPALASEAVALDERGEALATAGTYRAAALLLAPLGVAGLVTVLAAPMAVAALGVAMAAPVVLLRHGAAADPLRSGDGEGVA